MESLIQDLRYALRQLRKSPGFAAVAVATLALGIGANAAIFAVVNAVVLRPLPYPEPDRLVMIWEDYTRRGGPVREWHSYPNFADWRAESRTVREMAAWQGAGPTLSGEGEPERVPGAQVTHDFFRTLGVEAARGRTFTADEDSPSGPQAVVLGHGLWQRRYGGDPSVVGRPIVVDGTEWTVVGVLPRGFRFEPLGDVDLWTPLRLDEAASCGRACIHLRAIGRLAPGATPEGAEAELEAIAARLEERHPEANAGVGAAVFPLRDEIVGPVRPAMLVLLGAVGFVLLIACANVANLLLARAERRRTEVAIRTALGAERGRLLRQLLTESLVLAGGGAAVAVGLAWAAVELLPSLAPGGIPRLAEAGIDPQVLAFTAGVAVLAGLLFGIVPAVQASRPDPARHLKEGGRGARAGRSSGRLQAGLVVAQVALSLTLLVGAGLLLRSFLELHRVDLGFRTEGVLVGGVFLPPERYPEPERVADFHHELRRRVASLPGVASVGAVSSLPLTGANTDADMYIEGRPLPRPGEEFAPWYRIATPDYFRTLGIRLLQGRGLAEADGAETPPVVVVNRTMAERHWPGASPIGARVTFGDPQDADATWREVVGVVEDVRHFGVAQEEQAAVYLPFGQVRPRGMTLVVRADGRPGRLVGPVREELRAMDEELAFAALRPMSELVADSVAEPRFISTLLAVFAAVALALAAVGIYGVLSYVAARRTHEMGIRLALGAEAGDVLRMMVRRGMLLAGLGLLLGLAGAFAASRALEGLLFGVERADPLTYAGVVAVLGLVALAACAIPARRAAATDPIVALREE